MRQILALILLNGLPTQALALSALEGWGAKELAAAARELDDLAREVTR